VHLNNINLLSNSAVVAKNKFYPIPSFSVSLQKLYKHLSLTDSSEKNKIQESESSMHFTVKLHKHVPLEDFAINLSEKGWSQEQRQERMKLGRSRSLYQQFDSAPALSYDFDCTFKARGGVICDDPG
jgi:hypothetical protein